jgi:hypothetical protein
MFSVMANPFRSRPLTGTRIGLAVVVALLIDAVQLGLGPLGWTFVDEGLDIIGVIVISLLIGFHPLLLPTFVVELFPVVDMLPTWTGCVGAVILLRKRSPTNVPSPVASTASPPSSPKPSEPRGPVIDV